MKNLEKIINYIILSGFVLFTVGIILALLYWFDNYNTPLELELAVLGLIVLMLGMVAAKVFAEVKFF